MPRSDTLHPFPTLVTKGRAYHWCSCGESARQPLCDGSHSREGVYQPITLQPQADTVVLFCGCKASCNPPFCDGSHVLMDGLTD